MDNSFHGYKNLRKKTKLESIEFRDVVFCSRTEFVNYRAEVTQINKKYGIKLNRVKYNYVKEV